VLQTLQFPLTGGTPPTTTGATTTTGAPPGSSCTVAYSVTNSWSGGLQAQVTLTNTGTSAINGWILQWTFQGDEQISNLWNASFTQSGAQVTARAASFNGTVAPGTSVTIGFTANATNAAAPTTFTVNGSACGH
jgi:cellulase/cellobiase CelA1